MTIFDPLLDFFRGRAVTVPPLDGAFRPNRALDNARLVAEINAPVDMAFRNGAIVAAAGNALFELLENGAQGVVATFSAPIAAMAISSAGELAVACENGELVLDGAAVKLPPEVTCMTALSFAADGSMLVANGAAGLRPSQWRTDLMKKGASGSVWRLSRKGDATCLAAGLAWPSGILAAGSDVMVSEAWNRRILRVSDGLKPAAVFSNIPGYPGRLAQAESGALLSIFAPVNRLIEFVLQEDDYRAAMMEEIPAEYWIAPSLASGRSFLEPLQCGGIKTMGIHKPWAPSRSYGLIVRLDGDFQPVESFHSRADGHRHGIVAARALGDTIYAASAGGDAIVAIESGQDS